MRANLFAVIVVCCVLSGVALAVPATAVIDVGSHDLQENMSGQTIQLYVTGAAQVTAFNLKAQIGDGTGPNPEPIFEAIAFGGGMWDTHANTVVGGPIGGAEQFADAYVAFNTTASVPANGLLLTLTIDTTGFFDGDSFGLLLEGSEMGVDSNFVVAGGGALAADITNGTINIVPEPASIALMSIGGLLALRRRKRQ